MKSKQAIKREYSIVNKARRSRKKRTSVDQLLLMGFQQALAWVLDDNASRPTKCLTREP